MNLTLKAFVCINKWRKAESPGVVGRTRTSNIQNLFFKAEFLIPYYLRGVFPP